MDPSAKMRDCPGCGKSVLVSRMTCPYCGCGIYRLLAEQERLANQEYRCEACSAMLSRELVEGIRRGEKIKQKRPSRALRRKGRISPRGNKKVAS